MTNLDTNEQLVLTVSLSANTIGKERTRISGYIKLTAHMLPRKS